MSSTTKAKTKKPSRYYTPTTLKILFGQSGNECAEPQCSNPIIASATNKSDAANVADIAHIYALSVDGPRGKAGMTSKELNHHSNLMLLCPTHHTNVDTQYETYPADMLLKWKADHVRKHGDILRAKISDIGYSELETAARALMSDKPDGDEDDHDPSMPMAPANKIKKNNLTQGSSKLLKMGIAMSHEVKAMLRNAAQLDYTFPDRLRDGFQAKYDDFVAEGLTGDDLFDALYVWSGSTNSDPKRALAGLCLLSHLFVLCEVFES
ncbi:HNH endonuclease [Litorimonas haliclonae]